MGKLQQISIQLEQPDVAYEAGQRLLGCVNVTLNKPMKCRNLRLTLTGKAKTKWHEGSGDDSRTYRGREFYMNDVIILFGCPDGKNTTMIPEGHHQYPFEFVLPPDCPASIEVKCGWIRYYLTAVIDKYYLTCFATMPYRCLVPGQRLNLWVDISTTSKKGVVVVNIYLEHMTEFIANNGHAKIKVVRLLLGKSDNVIPGNSEPGTRSHVSSSTN